MQRTAIEDTELDGVAIPRDAVIDVCIGSANRDEARWENAEEFDIFRKRLPHITSPPASTPAWACIWRGWRPGSRWSACWTG